MAINDLRPSAIARAKEIVNLRISSFMSGYSYISNWTQRTLPENNTNWFSVARAPELGKFCAVSGNATNRSATSSDGITWSSSAIPASHVWQSVVWVPEYLRFVAVGTSVNLVSTKAVYSGDGVNWTVGTTPINDTGYTSVAWAALINTLCAVGKGTECAISTDGGVTWTAKAIPTAAGNGGSNSFNKVAYSPRYNRFVAVKIDTFMTSDDGGNNWVQQGASGTGWITGQTGSITWQTVVWAEEMNMFLAVARTSSVAGQIIGTSPDGITWTVTTQAAGMQQSWRDVAWASEINLFCLVANGGAAASVAVSSNGKQWTTSNVDAYLYLGITWASDLGIFFVSGNRIGGAGSGGSMTNLGDVRLRTYGPLYRAVSDL